MEFFSLVPHTSFCEETNGGVVKNRLFAPQASDALTCVAGVKRGGGREGKGEFGRAKARGARERDRESLLPRTRSRALIPFPFPFERLPRRLVTLGLIYILQSRQRCK